MNSDSPQWAIEVCDLTFGYDATPVLHAINLRVAEGESVALIGPNGAGKTSLLGCVTGLVRPAQGLVRLLDRDIVRMRSREIAAIVATVPQEFQIPFAYRVREIVALGRSPYLGRFGTLSEADHRAIDRALDETDTAEFQAREFNDLSGGERQRVVVALALAQQPKILLLDEPTAHLDLEHQLDVLRLVRTNIRERGVTVFAALHNVDLAAAFFERVVVIDKGRLVADGAPTEVVTSAMLREVFHVEAQVVPDADTEAPRVLPRLPLNGRA